MNKPKLSMCRICLVKNVRMYVVSNKNLQEIYEKLTDTPLVTEDRRPMLACFLCCNRLKQCYRLQQKCLKAEKLFAQILKEDCETKVQVNQDQFEFSGYTISPTVFVIITDGSQTESDVIKEELPGAAVAKKPKRNIQRTKLEDTTVAQLKKTKQPRLKNTQPSVNSSINDTAMETNCRNNSNKGMDNHDINRHQRLRIEKIPYNCEICQRIFYRQCDLTRHIRVHKNKSYKCDICLRSFCLKRDLTKHIRVHTGNKPYKCVLCRRRFRNRRNLSLHMCSRRGVTNQIDGLCK